MKKFNKGNAMMPMIIGVVAIILIAGGAFYFMNNSVSDPESAMVGDNNTNDAMMENDDAMMEDDDSMMMEDEADVEVTLEGGMFYFEPNVIEAEVGDTVRVTLNSVEGMHDFVIDEFDGATEIAQEGETVTATFVVDEAGEFEFYCSVGNHRAQGMVGTLVVSDGDDTSAGVDVEAELDL